MKPVNKHVLEDAAEQAHPIRSPHWALASLSLAMLLSSLGTSIANVSLPTLALAFDASFQQVQWVVIAYLLAVTTLIVSVGRLGDLFGQRRLLLIGIGVFSLASALCALAPRLDWLVAARALQGLGAAIMMALSMALLSKTVSKAKNGSAMGLLGTMSALGTALGPSLGGLLIMAGGWPAIFILSVPLGALTLLMAWRYLPADRLPAQCASGGFDPLGTLLLALALAAYALAMTLGRGLELILLLTALLFAGLFVLVETRVASPLVRLAMFKQQKLSAALGMSVLVATVMMTTLVVGPFYLADGLGLDAAQVGLVMSVGPLFAAVAATPAGQLTDRYGAPRILTSGLTSMAAGCLLLTVLPETSGVVGYVTPMMLLTLGYALFQTANNTAVMSTVAADQRGVMSGLLNLSRNLGLITGACAMGAVFAYASATGESALPQPASVAAAMRITFAVASLLIVVALGLAVATRKVAPDDQA